MNKFMLFCFVALTVQTSCVEPENGDGYGDSIQPQSADSLSDNWEGAKKVFKELGKLMDDAGAIYSEAETAIKVVKVILETFDIAEFKSAELLATESLEARLNQIAADLVWYSNELGSSTHLSQLISNLETARQTVERSQSDPTISFNINSPAFNGSAEHLAALENDLHYLRYFVPRLQDPGTLEGAWVNRIPAGDRAEAFPMSIPESPGSRFVYDWRLGVPRLMVGVAARISILAAADPGFTLATVRDDLMNRRAVLLKHYEKMISGVKCSTRDYTVPGTGPSVQFPWGVVEVTCADIYTGVWHNSDFVRGNIDGDRAACGRDQVCQDNVNRRWAEFRDKIPLVEEELRKQVLDSMPLFEMRSLIDTLYYYANRAPDLTEKRQRIAQQPGGLFCLDVQWGNFSNLTPVWMWECTGAEAQHWDYDRRTGSVVNPSAGRCLDVHDDAEAVVHVQDPIRGDVAISQRSLTHIADCNGSASQRWTYDLASGFLHSGAGSNVALVPEGPAYFPYLALVDSSWGLPFRPNPKWLADQ